MKPSMAQAPLANAILVDEIGIETGVYGSYRLKSSYQPTFAAHAGKISPVAVQGRIIALQNGTPVPSDQFFGQLPPADFQFIDRLSRTLHLRNHRNIGVDELELLVSYRLPVGADLATVLDEVACLADCLAEAELPPRLLICEITETALVESWVLAGLAAALRRHGVRLAIDDFGTGRPTLERVTLLRPDVVKLGGAWFRKLAADGATIRLLGAAIRGFHEEGARVVIDGIETPAQLAVALEVGADLLQGHLLGAPALAGTIFDETPRPVERLLEAERKIIPLFG